MALCHQGSQGTFSLRPLGGDGGVSFLCVEGPLDWENRAAYEL